MEFTARNLADLLNGEIEGNAEVTVNKLSKIEEGEPHSVSFLSNPQYNEYLYSTDASVVIVSKDLQLEQAVKDTLTLIRVEDPRMGFAKLLEAYNQLRNSKTGIEQPSFIAPSATIGEGVYIGAFAYVGEHAVIGDGARLHPNTFVGDGATVKANSELHAGVRVGHQCEVGESCTLQPGVIIGGDGFGFAPNQDNQYAKVPHTGNVVVEDHVEIGSNTTIDRATLGSTVIRKGVKLDNLIQIAHNVEIGENTVIAAQTGIAGSTTIGRDCMIGGQVGIVGHIKIADGVKIAAQSGIGASIEQKGAIVQGSPAFGIGDFKRSYVMFKNLPELKSRIDNLERARKADDSGAA